MNVLNYNYEKLSESLQIVNCKYESCFTLMVVAKINLEEAINKIKQKKDIRLLSLNMKKIIDNIGERGKKHPDYQAFHKRHTSLIYNDPLILDLTNKLKDAQDHLGIHTNIKKAKDEMCSIKSIIYRNEQIIEKLNDLKKLIKREFRIISKCGK